MTTILKIEVTHVRKQLCQIHLSDERVIDAHLESIYQYSLDKGREIDEKTIENLSADYDYFQLRSYGINLVGRRFYTEKEIRDKLAKRAVLSTNIEKVIQQLLRYDYIDDALYAEKFIKDGKKLKKHGVRKIKYDLLQKGIDENIIEKMLSETKEDLEDFAWENILKLCIKKRKAYIKEDPYKRRQKLYQYLSRRGYESAEIKKAIDKCELEAESEI